MPKTGRPPMGGVAKTEVVCTRITKQERDALAEEFVTPAKGVQYLIAEHLGRKTAAEVRVRAEANVDVVEVRALSEPIVDEVQDVPAEQLEQVAVTTPAKAVVSGHRHRRGQHISTEYVKGEAIKHYLCADPDCGATL